MKEGIMLSRVEASDIFLVLSVAKIKLQGKAQTTAKKYHGKLEEILLKDFIKGDGGKL